MHPTEHVLLFEEVSHGGSDFGKVRSKRLEIIHDTKEPLHILPTLRGRHFTDPLDFRRIWFQSLVLFDVPHEGNFR